MKELKHYYIRFGAIPKNERSKRGNGVIGDDGNAFAVMGYVLKAMRECKMSKEKQSDYQTKAMSGDYNNLLAISIEMIDLCNEIAEES